MGPVRQNPIPIGDYCVLYFSEPRAAY